MLKSLDRDDHEALQVERQPEARLVPDHRGDQRVHRVLGLVEVAARARRPAAGASCPARVRMCCSRATRSAGDQREQVARLRERVVPLREVAAAVERRPARPGCRWTAAPGTAGLVGAQRDRVDRHHVGPVEEVGDAAKALGLALREEAAARGVEPRQLGVLVGRAGVADLERERRRAAGPARVDHEHARLRCRNETLCAVDQHAREVEILAVQAQRLRPARSALRSTCIRLITSVLAGSRSKRQVDAADPVRRRGVVLAADQGGNAFAHGGWVSCGLAWAGRAIRRPASGSPR